METGGQWTGKTDNKKGPSANTATAGAKEIKVPYLFDERSDTAFASPPLHVTCGNFQTRSTTGFSGSLSNTALRSNNRPTLKCVG